MDVPAELGRHRYLNLATFRASGAEVRTPVWFVSVGGRFYVFSAGEAGKVKRLRRSSRARVAPCDARGGVRGPWRDAAAHVVTNPAVIAEARSAFALKYRWQFSMLNFFSRLSGRLRSRAWIEISL